jgi:hypothetical protein
VAEKAKAELAQLIKELSDLLGKMTDRWPIRNGFDKFYGFIGGEKATSGRQPSMTAWSRSNCRRIRTIS